MRVLFATDARVDAGSIQAIAAYVRAGKALGHDFELWGKEDKSFVGIPWAQDPTWFHHVVFIYESKLRWLPPIDQVRLMPRVPKSQRAIIDADGMYNDRIVVDGYDRTHWKPDEQAEWVAHMDALASRIFQPNPKPMRSKVRPLAFYGHPEAMEVPRGEAPEKELDVMLVGHNWWRWREVSTLILPALERLKGKVKGAEFLGRWWDEMHPSLVGTEVAIAFESDPALFARAGVVTKPSVPFSDVMTTMSKARINLMTQRPLFKHLRLLTSKFFEILCADTIPLALIDEDHAEAVYGKTGRELALTGGPEQIADKIADALARPDHYRDVVDEVRQHVRVHHGYDRRVRDLVAALEETRETA